MKKFNFEYTEDYILLRLIVISFLVYMLVVGLMLNSSSGKEGVPFAIVFMLIPIYMFKNRAKRMAFVNVADDKVQFLLNNKRLDIKFEDIVSYTSSSINRTSFKVVTSSTTVHLSVNKNVSDATDFNNFIKALDKKIMTFNKDNKITIARPFIISSTGKIMLFLFTIGTLLTLMSTLNSGGISGGKFSIFILALIIIWGVHIKESSAYQEKLSRSGELT